ncbi:MAG: nitrate reductase cytochrome c-type subunit [Rhodocyclaceae bacterium]
MKKLVVSLSICLLLAPALAQKAAPAAAPVQSLRLGEIEGPEDVSENFRSERDTAPLQRDFIQQPPLVPHSIKGYTITARFNKCLDCHSWSRAKQMGATKISLTHFKTADGAELSKVSPRRYFCTQCHVPQTDAKELVGNRFQASEGMR